MADCTTWLCFKQHFQSRILEYQKGRRTHTGGPAPAYGLHAVAYDRMYDNSTAPFAMMADTPHIQLANMAATQQALLDQIATIQEQFAALTAQHRQCQPPNPDPSSAPTNPSTKPKTNKKTPTNGQYCWSHGYKVKGSHKSATCTQQNPGHQTGATVENTMGGSIQGRPIAPALPPT